MGLGFGLAFGAGGASDAYQQLRDALVRQQQQQFENQERLKQDARADRTLDQQDTLTRLRIQEMADARAGAQRDKDIAVGNALGDQIPAGTVIPTNDPIVGMLRTAGRSSLLQHQDATLPSTSYTGDSTLPADGTAMRGTLRMATNAGNPEQYVKLPSEKQNEAATEAARKGEATDAAISARIAALNQATERLKMQGELNAANILRAQAEAAAANARATNTGAGKPLTLSAQGKSAKAAIEQAGPLTDQAIQLLEQQFPGIGQHPEQYNGALDKIKSLAGAAKYYAGFSDPNDPRRQIVSLLQPVQAGQYTRSSRSRQMLELALAHMADMAQTPAAQYQRLKDLRSIMPEMLEGIVRAEEPVDAAHPLAGSYFDPSRDTGSGVIYARDPNGQLHQAKAGTALPAGWTLESR